MPIYKIDGSETIVRNMTIYVEAENADEAERWAAGIDSWEDIQSCIVHYDEVVDGDIDEVTKVSRGAWGKSHKTKWKDGVAIT